jgi:D-alanine-D-alanine ligase
MKKIGLFFGGPGNEAKVSIMSARNIVDNFDYKKYDLVLIYWHKNREFYLLKSFAGVRKINKKNKISIEDFRKYFDIALLMTHGKYGEDGVLQAILESQKIKYTGCGVLSSALCMDKAIFKELLCSHNITQVKFEILDYVTMSVEELNDKLKIIRKKFSLPIFVKPANSGSSIGISKVKNFKEINRAIKGAKKHDHKIIIEEGVKNPIEVEIAILGNKNPIVSLLGQLVPVNDFYDYDDKYLLNKTKLIIPAKLPSRLVATMRKMALQTYKLCGCSGFARIDFLIRGDKVFLSEINSLPGFTKNSMYPRLMMNAGLTYKNLINKIIGFAK